VKLGVLLPTFQNNAEQALAFAEQAQRAGIDGVFAYDHMFPIGSPERPTLAPLPVLAAVASRLPLTVGTLIARVTLVSTAQLVEQFTTLEEIAPGRVIAALGTGDKLSKPEHDAYGLPYPSPGDRRALLRDAVAALSPHVPVWCGAGSPATNDVARELGVALNLWGVSAEEVRAQVANGPVTWGGQLQGDVASALNDLQDAGASWVVAGTPAPLDALEEWRRTH
jgi:alkanesulfonate monooxygenase SsuD/methylene tetrahydromethanopterin reductase-like flavin-dependent oxidoreductase (luciferase family)